MTVAVGGEQIDPRKVRYAEAYWSRSRSGHPVCFETEALETMKATRFGFSGFKISIDAVTGVLLSALIFLRAVVNLPVVFDDFVRFFSPFVLVAIKFTPANSFTPQPSPPAFRPPRYLLTAAMVNRIASPNTSGCYS
jgi:hypothetical protein